jgi:hypothetical protein
MKQISMAIMSSKFLLSVFYEHSSIKRKFRNIEVFWEYPNTWKLSDIFYIIQWWKKKYQGYYNFFLVQVIKPRDFCWTIAVPLELHPGPFFFCSILFCFCFWGRVLITLQGLPQIGNLVPTFQPASITGVQGLAWL